MPIACSSYPCTGPGATLASDTAEIPSMETLSHSPNSQAHKELNGDTGGALLQLLTAQGQFLRSSGMALRGEGHYHTWPKKPHQGLKMLKTWVKAHRNEHLAI